MAGDTHFDKVVLLLKCEGANNGTVFTDSSFYNRSIRNVGSPITSTTHAKFGASSFYSRAWADDGLLCVDDTSGMSFPGDLTMECWIYPADTGAYRTIFGISNAGGAPALTVDGTHLLVYSVTAAHQTAVTANAWHHVAFTRSGTNCNTFLDGVKSTTTNTSSETFGATRFIIGASTDSQGDPFKGWIDEVRITNGYCRYTANFTPSVTEFEAYMAQVSGNISESLGIASWRVSAHKCATGLRVGTAVATGSTYTVDVASSDPVNITLSPKIDYKWSTSKVAVLGDFCVPSAPDTTPRLYECTTAGTTSSTTEPTWPSSGTVADGAGALVWTFVADLVDPKCLGPKIPT